MFEDGIAATPSVSGPPTRPGTGKTAKSPVKGKPILEKAKILLPRPAKLKQFFADSRLVTHG